MCFFDKVRCCTLSLLSGADLAGEKPPCMKATHVTCTATCSLACPHTLALASAVLLSVESGEPPTVATDTTKVLS